MYMKCLEYSLPNSKVRYFTLFILVIRDAYVCRGSVVSSNSATAAAPAPTSIQRTHNSFAPPLFTPATTAAVVAPVVATHPTVSAVAPPSAVPSLHSSTHPNTNPFSAESLFQSSKGINLQFYYFHHHYI